MTLHVLRQSGVAANVHVARDGEQALDFVFCRGEFADRPVHFAEFQDTIRQMGLYWLQANQPPPLGQ